MRGSRPPRKHTDRPVIIASLWGTELYVRRGGIFCYRFRRPFCCESRRCKSWALAPNVAGFHAGSLLCCHDLPDTLVHACRFLPPVGRFAGGECPASRNEALRRRESIVIGICADLSLHHIRNVVDGEFQFEEFPADGPRKLSCLVPAPSSLHESGSQVPNKDNRSERETLPA